MANKLKDLMKNGLLYLVYEKNGVVVVTNDYQESNELSKEGFRFIIESSSKNAIAKVIERDIKPAALFAEDEILKKTVQLYNAGKSIN